MPHKWLPESVSEIQFLHAIKLKSYEIISFSNYPNRTTEDSAELIKEITGFTVKETGIGDKTKLPIVSPLIMKRSNERLIRITFLVCIVIISIISAAFTIFIFHRNGKFREKIKGFMKMSEEWIRFDYQVKQIN